MILVADPVRMTADLLVRRLRADGYEALAFGTGPGALARLAQGGIDAVIVDPALGAAGPAASSIVAKIHAAAPEIPILAFGTNDRASATATALSEGATAFLVKGRVTPTQLVARLRELLANAGATRSLDLPPAEASAATAADAARTSNGYYVWVQAHRGDADRLGAEIGCDPGLRCSACGSVLSLYLQRDPVRWGTWLFGLFGCLVCAKRSVAPRRAAPEGEESGTPMHLQTIAETLAENLSPASSGGAR